MRSVMQTQLGVMNGFQIACALIKRNEQSSDHHMIHTWALWTADRRTLEGKSHCS